MTEIADKPDGTFAITDIWWGSYMSRAEKLRGKAKEPAELKFNDVRRHRKAVGQLWMRLRSFESALGVHLPK